jgi:uncharacterized protein (DUF488 family)
MDKATLYTIGHSNRPIADFLSILREVSIKRLVDVRALPRSRRWPQYDGEALAHSLAEHGIEYIWRGEVLGGFRKPAPDSPNVALRGALRAFADHMATTQFADAIALLASEAARTPLAIMCAEKAPSDCHRALIADYALVHGVEVLHLLDLGQQEPARIDPRARVLAGRLIYDSGPQLPFR